MCASTHLFIVITSAIVLQVNSSPVATSYSYRSDGTSGYEHSYGINRVIRSNSDHPLTIDSYSTFIVHGRPVSYGSYPPDDEEDLSFYENNGGRNWVLGQPEEYVVEYWPRYGSVDEDYSEYDDEDDESDDYSENTFWNDSPEGYRYGYGSIPGPFGRVFYDDGKYQNAFPDDRFWIK